MQLCTPCTKFAITLGVEYGLVEKVIRPRNDRIHALTVHPDPVDAAMQ